MGYLVVPLVAKDSSKLDLQPCVDQVVDSEKVYLSVGCQTILLLAKVLVVNLIIGMSKSKEGRKGNILDVRRYKEAKSSKKKQRSEERKQFGSREIQRSKEQQKKQRSEGSFWITRDAKHLKVETMVETKLDKGVDGAIAT